MPHSGKEKDEFMEKVVFASLGRKSGRVVVGPGRGLDNGVVAAWEGSVMLVTADPLSAIPAFGMRLSARMSVHLIASDFTASGVDPEYAAFTYNFPPSMKREQREAYVRAVGEECRLIGVAIVAGHTGSYPGGGYTVIGSGVMLGFAPEDGYVTPSMAREGDAVLVTKSAGMEAAATLALSFPQFLARRAGEGAVRRAAGMSRLCSTVTDSRAARTVGLGKGGVTSMHDATEGGILGAISEMAHASGKAFVVDREKVPVSEEAGAVCGAFGLDPLKTMGEGSLVITCARERVSALKAALARARIKATDVGRVEQGAGLWLSGRGETRRSEPGRDRFWAAYDRAARLGLK